MDERTIPVIDFASGNTDVASNVTCALREFGAFYLFNHGIEEEVITGAFAKSQEFFKSNEDLKLSCAAQVPGDRGYAPFAREQILGRPSRSEAFGYCPDPACRIRWPDESLIPGFHATILDFHETCAKLTKRLLNCLDVALDVPTDLTLRDCHSGGTSVTSLLHYPENILATEPHPPSPRAPAHADPNTITLLFQQRIGGLQIADPSTTPSTRSETVDKTATFIDVPPRPGSVVVFAGYLLMRWTNRHIKHCIHRAITPQGATASHEPERYSILYFAHPNAGVEVTPLRSLCSIGHRFAPLNASTYCRSKREQTESLLSR